jgi:hypothetical protein
MQQHRIKPKTLALSVSRVLRFTVGSTVLSLHMTTRGKPMGQCMCECLTSSSRILPEKLLVAQLVKKLSALMEPERPLPYHRRILKQMQSTLSFYSFTFNVNIDLPFTPRSPKWSLSFRFFQLTFCMHFSPPPRTHITRLSRPPWSDNR